MAVSLNKVILEKTGDTHKVDLSKSSDQKIVINLNWSSSKKTGFFNQLFGRTQEIDLDLGCYYELNNGMSSVIDGIQFSKGRGGRKDELTKQGRYTDFPWIWHCGDDRTGSNEGGENILVNSKGIKDLRRIIVYCFIYEGVAKWAESDAVVTVKVSNHPDIIVEMGKQVEHRTFCAIASIEFNDNRMLVRKEITFHQRHKQCDEFYGWGGDWSAGDK